VLRGDFAPFGFFMIFPPVLPVTSDAGGSFLGLANEKTKTECNRCSCLRLAAEGLSQDEISARVGIRKHALRARFIGAIKRGEAIAAERRRAAIEAADSDFALLTPDEVRLLEAIIGSFERGDWLDPDYGNLLFGGARTIEEAIEDCRQYGKLLHYKYRSSREAPEKK
jgi:hypothetical protein